MSDGQGWRSLSRSVNNSICSSVLSLLLAQQCRCSLFYSRCSNRKTTRPGRQWGSWREQHWCGTARVVLGSPLGSAGSWWATALSVIFSRHLVSNCTFGWGRSWAGGISISHWLRTVYLKRFKTQSDPVCIYLLSSQLSLPAILGTYYFKCQNFLWYENIEQQYCPVL